MNEKLSTQPRVSVSGTCGGASGTVPCPFWQPPSSELAASGMPGECRLSPPKVGFVMVRVQRKVDVVAAEKSEPAIEHATTAAFPPMYADGWCGKHPAVISDTMLDLFEDLMPEVSKIFSMGMVPVSTKH
jgi:hypothetical protein